MLGAFLAIVDALLPRAGGEFDRRRKLQVGVPEVSDFIRY